MEISAPVQHLINLNLYAMKNQDKWKEEVEKQMQSAKFEIEKTSLVNHISWMRMYNLYLNPTNEAITDRVHLNRLFSSFQNISPDKKLEWRQQVIKTGKLTFERMCEYLLNQGLC